MMKMLRNIVAMVTFASVSLGCFWIASPVKGLGWKDIGT